MTYLDWSSDDMLQRQSPLDDDIIAHNFIHKRFLEQEVELYTAKWFDYRTLTPMQATRLYIEAFGRVYRDKFAKFIDSRAAEFIRVLDVDRVIEGLANSSGKDHTQAKTMFASCWRGRQVADILGMPYETYIALAMEYRMRFWQRSHLPKPQHLYNELDVEKIQAKWEEMQQFSMLTSDHPAYMTQNYLGIGYQNDYHEWLFKLASKRGNPAASIAQLVDENRLPLDKVEARLEPREFERVQSYLH